ncbi:hypothetical protein BD779DRAFT_1580157 [Infundibulicybe gibba]|nr:hypothetical protein BD779DRAFT_1580157 [Infundibulicybe gibba]
MAPWLVAGGCRLSWVAGMFRLANVVLPHHTMDNRGSYAHDNNSQKSHRTTNTQTHLFNAKISARVAIFPVGMSNLAWTAGLNQG